MTRKLARPTSAYILIVVAASMLAAVLGGSPSASSTDPVRIVVGIEWSTDLRDAERELRTSGIAVHRTYTDLHAVEVHIQPATAPRLTRLLEQVSHVRYAEPVVAMTTADQPADPLYASRQSGYLGAVTAPAAWDITTGHRDVIVAVVDTGVDVLHADLAPNVWVNANEIANNGVDDDANGCVDDVNGCSFVSDSSPGCQNITNGFVQDDIGHGTFVAGVIAAASNGTGMVGVARNVRIMPVRVLDCYGAGDSVATARGVLYAARNGARIANLSLGGLPAAQVLSDAISQARRDYGMLTIAAAGNSGAPGVAYPARLPDVMAVGAAAPGGNNRATFSSYGAEVDVVAVGESVVGTVPARRCNVLIPCIGGEPYGVGAGTSFSAPQAAGLAALMLSIKRDLPPQRIVDIIKATARPLSDGNAPNWDGAGRIDMAAALRAVQNDRPAGDPCTVERVIDGDSFVCAGGRTVRMLQINAPDLGQCGGDWARAALQYIFLTPGRVVYLQYDVTRSDGVGRTLAWPIWRGPDGSDFNLSIVLAYVGLARAADVGTGNVALRDWAQAAEHWAQAARWNMWAPGKTFNGGC